MVLTTLQVFLSVVQSLSRVWLCHRMGWNIPGFPVLHYLLEFAQTSVHWVNDAIQPSHPLLPPPFLLPSVFPSIRVFSSESVLCIMWPKLGFSFRISPSNEYSRLISFRIDWVDFPAAEGTLKNLLQHHSSKASVLWCLDFFMVQFSRLYGTTGKIIPLTRRTFVSPFHAEMVSIKGRNGMDLTRNRRN